MRRKSWFDSLVVIAVLSGLVLVPFLVRTHTAQAQTQTAPPPHRPQQLEVRSQNITSDTTLSADRLILRGSPTIRVSSGVRLVLDCTTLEVEGQAFIDARGTQGSAGGAGGGTNPDHWDSSGSGYDCGGQHNAWVAAGGHPNDRGGNGGQGNPGTSGGTIEVRYHTVVSAGADSSLGAVLRYAVNGGAGGPGGPGGPGRRLECGCHHETKTGPSGSSGAQGAAGADGRFVDARF